MNSLGLNSHVKPCESSLVRPDSEAARDRQERTSSCQCETLGSIKATDLWPLGNWSTQRNEGRCPNHSICYRLPLALFPHSKTGIQDILKWRRLLLGVCLKPSNDWLEAEVPGHEPSTLEFMGANQPAEPNSLIPPDRQFSLSNVSRFGAKNRRPPAPSWAWFLGPKIHVFFSFSSQSIFPWWNFSSNANTCWARDERKIFPTYSHMGNILGMKDKPRGKLQASHSLQGTRQERLFWTNTEVPLWASVCMSSDSDCTCCGSRFSKVAHSSWGFCPFNTRKSSGIALTGRISTQLMIAYETQMWTIFLNAVRHSRQKHHPSGMARLWVTEKFHCREIEIMTPLQLWKEMRWLSVKMPWWIGLKIRKLFILANYSLGVKFSFSI